MALLSGEVETVISTARAPGLALRFRMALLSGEVETPCGRPPPPGRAGSGWLCYPGKLKPSLVPVQVAACPEIPDGFAIRGS